MRASLTLLLALSLSLFQAPASPAAVIPLVPPDHVDRPGEVTVAALEASIYSLPYFEARTEFNVEDEGIIVSPTVEPVLRFPWKVVDHSRGLNITSELGVRVYRDTAFPVGEEERWEEVEAITKRVSNRDRVEDSQQSRFDRQGDLLVHTRLLYAEPVVRYKVVLGATVRSSMHSTSSSKERVFHLCLTPQWKGVHHQHATMMRTLLLSFHRKRALLRWRAWLADATLANRSLRDAGRFGDAEILKILEDTKAATERDPSDDELEELAFDLMNESGRTVGRLTERIGAVNREILGVTRLGFSALEAIRRLDETTASDLRRVAYYRNLLVTFLAVEREAEATERIDRVVFFANEEARALRSLWYCTNTQMVATMLGKLQKALTMQVDELTALARRLGGVLGRSKDASGGWAPLPETRLYKELHPAESLGNKDAVTSVIRSVYQGLYYRLVTQLYHVRIMAAAAKKSLEPFELDAPVVATAPPLADDVLPGELCVTVPLTGQNIKPGDVADYRLTVRNLYHQPREVRLVEVRKLPSGWFSRLTDETVLLQPGEQRTVTYAVTAPFYTAQTMTSRSSLRVFFTDDPGRFHEPVFQTRCQVGPEVEGVAGDGPAHLTVEAPDSQQSIRPGGVASYVFAVRHDGPSKKLATFDVVSEIPEGWVVEAVPRRLYLQPGLPERVTLKVTAPLYMKKTQRLELVVGVGYADEFDAVERIRLTTLVTDLEVVQALPILNEDQTRTFYVPREGTADLTATIRNTGNVDDTFDLFLDAPPRGWYAALGTRTVTVKAGGDGIRIPLAVRAPATLRAGSHEKLHLTAVSVTHPEIRAEADMVVTLVEDKDLEVVPLQRQYRVAPGDSVDVSLRATNRSDSPVDVGFRTALTTDRPTWLEVRDPVATIAPEASRLVSGHLRIPTDEKVGQVIPFAVSAVNDRGDEIGAVTFEAAVCRRHGVEVVLDTEGTTRSSSLVTVRLMVTNTGTVTDTVVLMLTGGVRRWLARLSASRITVPAGETVPVRLFVKVPPDATKDQPVVAEVQAKSATDSSARDFVRVEVQP